MRTGTRASLRVVPLHYILFLACFQASLAMLDQIVGKVVIDDRRFEVPEYLGLAAAGDDGSLSMLEDYYLPDELLGLLQNGDGAGSSAAHAHQHHGSTDEKLSPARPQPPSTATVINTASDQHILSWSPLSGEAEMASWLRQVFEEGSEDHEPQGAASNKPGTSATTARARSSRDRDGLAVAADTSVTDGGAAARKRPEGASKAECCGGCCRPRSSAGKRPCAGRASEQRYRDKINEKMRTLQQLVPRCSKTDKASTLDGVIRYMKSLQHQLQVLSNGYALQTATILPPGVVQPPYMQPADAFGSRQPLMLPPQYPFVPATFACPHHGNGMPPPPLFHPAAAGSSATQQLRRHHHHHQVRSQI